MIGRLVSIVMALRLPCRPRSFFCFSSEKTLVMARKGGERRAVGSQSANRSLIKCVDAGPSRPSDSSSNGDWMPLSNLEVRMEQDPRDGQP